MSRIRLVSIFLAISFFTTLIPLTPSVNSETGWQWEGLPPMLHPSAGYAEVYNGEIYHIGEEYIQVYSPGNNTWWVFGYANTGYRGGSAIIGDRIYFLDGHDAKYLNLTTVAYVDITDPPTYRIDFGVVALDNELYVIGGCPGGLVGTDIVEVYSPANNSWWNGTNLDTPRYGHEAILYENQIYVVGGMKDYWNGTKSVEHYNPINKSWSYLAPTQNFCRWGSMTQLSQCIVLENGVNSEVYDFKLNTWIKGPEVPWSGEGWNHAMITLNNEAYVVGGRLADDTPLNHFYRWDGLESKPPSIAINSHSNLQFVNQTVNVTGNASDNFQLDMVEVSMDNISWTPCTGNESWYQSLEMTEGLNTIYARATDYFNNTQIASVEVIHDTTPPLLNISCPANNTATSETPISINGTAYDRWGLGQVRARVNEGEWIQCTGQSEWSVDITLAEGNNDIQIMLNDSANNSRSASMNIVLDTELPNITITSPANNTMTADSSVTISGEASDNIGIEKVELNNGSGTWTLCSGIGDWSGDVNLHHGINTIQARATDEVGNTNVTSITVIADFLPPELTITSHQDGANLTEANITIFGTAADDSAMVVEARLNGGAWALANGTENWQANFTLEEGQNTIAVRATDSLGHSSELEIELEYWSPDDNDTEDPADTTPEVDDDTPDAMSMTIMGMTIFLLATICLLALLAVYSRD